MTTQLPTRTPTTRMPRRSWILVLAAEILALVQALFMLVIGGVNGSIEEYLGYADHNLRTENPHLSTVLHYTTHLLGLWGVTAIGLAIVITLIPYRKGHRWAWCTMWALPAMYLAALPLEIVVFGDAWPDVGGLGITVLYFAIPAAVGLAFGTRHTHRGQP